MDEHAASIFQGSIDPAAPDLFVCGDNTTLQ